MVFDNAFVLPTLVAGTRLHVGFLFMLVMTAAMTLFVFRSFAGYRLQVGGLAPQAARYAGFRRAGRYGRRCWCRAGWQALLARSR